MGFEVKIKKWHAVASWTWNAGGQRAPTAAPAPSRRSPAATTRSAAVPPAAHRPHSPLLLPPQATTCVASAACPLTAARPTASSRETTAPWCGAPAPTHSTCSASTGVPGQPCLQLAACLCGWAARGSTCLSHACLLAMHGHGMPAAAKANLSGSPPLPRSAFRPLPLPQVAAEPDGAEVPLLPTVLGVQAGGGGRRGLRHLTAGSPGCAGIPHC